MGKKLIAIILSVVFLIAVSLFVYLHQSDDTAAIKEGSATAEHNKQESSKKDVREAVWGQLSDKHKEQIKGTWRDGEVSKIRLDENALIVKEGDLVNEKSYSGKEVYMIDFPTKSMAIPNNMLVLADMDTFEFIGLAPVD